MHLADLLSFPTSDGFACNVYAIRPTVDQDSGSSKERNYFRIVSVISSTYTFCRLVLKITRNDRANLNTTRQVNV